MCPCSAAVTKSHASNSFRPIAVDITPVRFQYDPLQLQLKGHPIAFEGHALPPVSWVPLGSSCSVGIARRAAALAKAFEIWVTEILAPTDEQQWRTK